MANFEFESNNNIATANRGFFGVANGGQLHSTTDTDVFRFNLTQSSALGISFRLPENATNDSFSIKVKNSLGDIIFSNQGGADFSNITFSAVAGIYYFEISAGAEFTDRDYGLTVTTLPSVEAFGEIEGNDTAVSATAIILGEGAPLVDEVSTATVIANLSDVNDQDYFKFNSMETGVYQFRFSAPTNVEPDEVLDTDPAGTVKEFFAISILDANENVLITHYVSGTTEEGYTFDFALNSILNPTGDYYVKIENGGSINSINTQQYKFEINPVETSTENSVQVAGGALADYLLGTSISDYIRGNAGNDIMVGMDGSDILDGGLGSDTMKGGFGGDTYLVDTTGDLVIENSNQGVDKVITSVKYTLTANVENLVLADAVTNTAGILVGVTSGTGNALDNIIVGNQLANTLTGLAGNDTLDGGLGARGDTLVGGAGDDTYYINNSLDKVTESANGGMDTVLAKVNVVGTTLASNGLASNVENLILLEVGPDSDGDTLPTYGVGNTLANTINGNSAANQLYGLAGDDTIYGGAGNDALVGGLGNDVLVGGSGSDVFVFEKGLSATTNVDYVVDFESGVDALQLSKSIFTKLVGPTGNDYVGELSVDNFYEGTAAADANDFIIYDASTGNLFYDSDGSAVKFSQVLFANLGAGTALTYEDFIVL